MNLFHHTKIHFLAIMAFAATTIGLTGCGDPPEACFEIDATVVDQNFPVLFTNCSVFQQNGYAWDFGDGTTSNSVSPIHKFGAQGEYIVVLTALGKRSDQDDTYSEIIKVAQRRLTLMELNGLPTTNGSVPWDAGDNPDVAVIFQDAFTGAVEFTSSIISNADPATVIDLDETAAGFEISPKSYNLIVVDDDQGSMDTMAVINFNFDNYQPDESRTAVAEDITGSPSISVKYDLF